MSYTHLIHTHTRTHDKIKLSNKIALGMSWNFTEKQSHKQRERERESNECSECSDVFHSPGMICQPMLLLSMPHFPFAPTSIFIFICVCMSCTTISNMFIHAFVTAPHNRFLYFYLSNDFQ